MNLTNDQVARILAVPSSRVTQVWPLVDSAVASLAGDQWTDYGRIAALATIRVECPPFAPIRERGSDAYFVEHYWTNEKVRGWLGNRSPEDAIRFCGRGLVQITGRENYTRFGNLIGVDLLSDPDVALEPNTSAALFAAYFYEHKKCLPAANANDWTKVREIVNGGHNGLKAFLLLVQMLGQATGMRDVVDTAAAQFKVVRDQN